MIDEMGSFRIDIEIGNAARTGPLVRVSRALVDTGAELSCLPGAVLEEAGVPRLKRLRFRQADGTVFERWTGPAFVHAAGTFTVDEVIFGEPNDLILLGSRSLEGLNLRVDPVSKTLIDAGPMPLAATTLDRGARGRLTRPSDVPAPTSISPAAHDVLDGLDAHHADQLAPALVAGELQPGGDVRAQLAHGHHLSKF